MAAHLAWRCGARAGGQARPQGLRPLLPLLSEPICAVGHGVAALCCATNEDRSWVFQGYSVTGVSAAREPRQESGLAAQGQAGSRRGPVVPCGGVTVTGTRLAIV